MAKVLITGVAGFIGMHTAIRFIKEGWDVTGIDNMNNYYSVQLKKDRLKEIHLISKSLGRQFIFYSKDLNSNVWDDLSNSHFDALIHLAAQAGVRYSLENPMIYLKSNIIGFQKVLDFVVLKKVKKFIYASSSSVYGKNSNQPFSENDYCNSPESYYAATKKANELMAHAYYKTKGLKSVGLRFFTVFGPWGRPDMAPMIFTKAIMENTPIKVFNHGKQKRDFTFIDDVVEGIYSVINLKITNTEVFNIGQGKPTELLNFIKNIEAILSRTVEKVFISEQLGDVKETYADITRLHQKTGYSPQTDTKTGLEHTIKWYKKYYK